MINANHPIGQKEALLSALQFTESPFSGDGAKMKAARTLFLIMWLHDKNWHAEALALKEKIIASAYLKKAYDELKRIDAKWISIDVTACFHNWMYGRGLNKTEWHATRGTALVEELWEIVYTQL